MQETALWERLTSTEDGRNLYRNNLIFNRTVLALQMCRTQTEEVQVLADELVASVKLIDDLNESLVDARMKEAPYLNRTPLDPRRDPR